MAHATYLRDKARAMRVERQLTIDELAARLALSRSTIYYWVRDLPLPRRSGFTTRAQRLGNLRMRQKYRLMREAAYAEGLQTYPVLSREVTFRDFVTLYIAEGYKRSRNEVEICNSDPAIVRLGNAWITRFSRNPIRYSVQFHADQDIDGLVEFWAEQLRVLPESVRLVPKSNSGRLSGRTWRCEHGVLQVATTDTRLRASLQAWIDCLHNEWLDSLRIGA